MEIEKIMNYVLSLPIEQQRLIFSELRNQFGIHPLEIQLNASAEVILEAISRASDLTLRGVRGIIAEAAFKKMVLDPLSFQGLISEIPLVGDYPYDYLVTSAGRKYRIQVKMQRQKSQRPMYAAEASKRHFSQHADLYVVETQKTRGGTDTNGESTRPYRFEDFDLLAVSLQPSTGDWSQFVYAPTNVLIPDANNPNLINKFQPIFSAGVNGWSSSLLTAISSVK